MVACNICSSIRKKPMFNKNSYSIVRCTQCGLVYVNNMPTEEESSRYYDKEFFKEGKDKFGYIDYEKERFYMERNFRRKIAFLEKYKKNGSILDVGCGMGLFLELLDNKKWQKVGLDISDYAVKHVKENLKINAIKGDIANTDFPRETFDVVTMWDTLDHTRDPLASLHNVNRILKEKGVVIFNLGDINSLFAKIMKSRWYLMIPPTHLYFFNKESIRHLLSKIGFEIADIKYFGKVVSLELCFFRLSYIFKHRLIDQIYKFTRKNFLKRINVYINFLDLMTICARKKT